MRMTAIGLAVLATVSLELLAPGASAANPGYWSTIAAGGDATCAVTTAGGVKCWGLNGRGQIGDGTSGNYRPAPVDVVGLTRGVRTVTEGDVETCAITTLGGVKCWGANDRGGLGNGQSGNGDPIGSPVPVDVTGLSSGVVAVSVENFGACALTTSDGVKCWGGNTLGELGDGTTNDSSVPVDVVGLTSGVRAIASGGNANCALTSAGGVKCWGGGLGSSSTSALPLDVPGFTSGVASISVGESHACAVLTSGGLKCWGSNGWGESGTTFSAGIAGVAAGTSHTCASTTAGTVKCWGFNYSGQLGNNTTTSSATPVDVVGLSGVGALAAGISHTCAVTTAGEAKCWGNDSSGELGVGYFTSNSPVPLDVYVASRLATALSASPTAVKYHGLTKTVALAATLTDPTAHLPVGGQTITFTVGTAGTCTGVTGSDGIARCTLTLSVFKFVQATYTASYAGNSNYLPSSGTAPINRF
jgi:alpha-tubulin suppressor-like RCC1 family protein